MEIEVEEKEERREKRKERICPRCGLPGFKTVMKRGDKLYIYYGHTYKADDGKYKTRYCYIGPQERYDYVAKMYDVDMKHAFDLTHRKNVFEALLDDLLNISEEKEDIRKWLSEKLKEALREIERTGNNDS